MPETNDKRRRHVVRRRIPVAPLATPEEIATYQPALLGDSALQGTPYKDIMSNGPSDRRAKPWHGGKRACPCCGNVVPRHASQCGSCGQGLKPSQLDELGVREDIWYVLDHERQLASMDYDSLAGAVQTGQLPPTAVVRGPGTMGQWRMVGESRGLSNLVGLCWQCSAPAGPNDETCNACGAAQTVPAGAAARSGQRTGPRGELGRLAESIRPGSAAEPGPRAAAAPTPPHRGFAAAIVAIVVLVVFNFVQLGLLIRSRAEGTAPPTAAAPEPRAFVDPGFEEPQPDTPAPTPPTPPTPPPPRPTRPTPPKPSPPVPTPTDPTPAAAKPTPTRPKPPAPPPPRPPATGPSQRQREQQRLASRLWDEAAKVWSAQTVAELSKARDALRKIQSDVDEEFRPKDTDQRLAEVERRIYEIRHAAFFGGG